jgi:antirestriction protein ArdC
MQILFTELLNEALERPGVLSACYSQFYNYSLGNQMALWSQLAYQGKELQPVATYKRWAASNRQVRKGEKSMSIMMPITFKDKVNPDNSFTKFMLKNCIFAIDQTEGDTFAPELKIPTWDSQLALATLNIAQVNFTELNGNCQGFASGKSIAVNPIAAFPHKTRFHELAHVVLGHTKAEAFHCDVNLSRNVEEVEAESVAYILCSLLGMEGTTESRGYIQHWLKGAELQDKTAQRIFSAANKILKAGQAKEIEDAAV